MVHVRGHIAGSVVLHVGSAVVLAVHQPQERVPAAHHGGRAVQQVEPLRSQTQNIHIGKKSFIMFKPSIGECSVCGAVVHQESEGADYLVPCLRSAFRHHPTRQDGPPLLLHCKIKLFKYF